MSNQIIISPKNELVNNSLSPMQMAGKAANHFAEQNAFTDYLERKAERTRMTQRNALAKFAEFLEAANVPNIDADCLQNDPQCWQDIEWGLVEAFKKWLLKEGYSTATVNNRLSVVKVYAKLASTAGAMSTDNYARIRLVSGYSGKEAKRIDEKREVTRTGHKKAEHTSLTDSQVKTLKDWMIYEGEQGARDCLLMCLLLDHGLRCGEVAILKAGDFNLADSTFTLYRPKVDITQTHKMTKDTLQALEHYLNARPENVENDLLLVGSTRWNGLTNKPMSTRAITKRVKYLGETLLGVEKLSAHDCRHNWASSVNGDVFALQEAGGWKSLTMPRHYKELAKVANEGIKLSR